MFGQNTFFVQFCFVITYENSICIHFMSSKMFELEYAFCFHIWLWRASQCGVGDGPALSVHAEPESCIELDAFWQQWSGAGVGATVP